MCTIFDMLLYHLESAICDSTVRCYDDEGILLVATLRLAFNIFLVSGLVVVFLN